MWASIFFMAGDAMGLMCDIHTPEQHDISSDIPPEQHHLVQW